MISKEEINNSKTVKPVRVLHVLHNMGLGGIETALMDYYRHLDKNKIQFDFLLTGAEKDCSYADEIKTLGGRIYRIPPLTKKNPFKYIKALNDFFKNHSEYLICHAHSTSKSVIPLYIAKIHGVKHLVAHSHSATELKGIEGILLEMLKKPLRKVATNWFSCSDLATKFLYGEENLHNEKVRVIKNVIDTEKFAFNIENRRKIRSLLGIKESEVVIGTVGRLSATKNQKFIIDVLNKLKDNNSNFKGIIVGNGELEESLKNYAKEMNLQDILIFTGGIRNVEDYLQAIDIFLLPSFKEGFGMAAIEAQSSGLPCLVSDGVPLECNVTGLVKFLPLDIEIWKNEIEKIVNNLPARKSHVKQVKEGGYDAGATAKKLEEIYLQIVTAN